MSCDRLLATRAQCLVDLGALGAEFRSDDPPRATTPACSPPVAVLLTLIRALDQATVMEVHLNPTPPSTPPPNTRGSFSAA